MTTGGHFGFDDDDEIADAPTAVAYLKERVYVCFTGTAIVLVLFESADHVDPLIAFTTLLIGLLGVTAAAVASDVIAHLSVDHEFPDAREMLALSVSRSDHSRRPSRRSR